VVAAAANKARASSGGPSGGRGTGDDAGGSPTQDIRVLDLASIRNSDTVSMQHMSLVHVWTPSSGRAGVDTASPGTAPPDALGESPKAVPTDSSAGPVCAGGSIVGSASEPVLPGSGMSMHAVARHIPIAAPAVKAASQRGGSMRLPMAKQVPMQQRGGSMRLPISRKAPPACSGSMQLAIGSQAFFAPQPQLIGMAVAVPLSKSLPFRPAVRRQPSPQPSPLPSPEVQARWPHQPGQAPCPSPCFSFPAGPPVRASGAAPPRLMFRDFQPLFAPVMRPRG